MHTEEVQETTHRHARILWVCGTVVVFFIIIHNAARPIYYTLEDDPRVLIVLSPSLDHTLLVAPYMSMQTFLLIGILRRLIVDPFWYTIGYVGADGLRESRFELLRDLPDMVKRDDEDRVKGRFTPKWVWRLRLRLENYFSDSRHKVKWVLVWHFVTADAMNSFLLGKYRVSPWKWVPVNLAGTALTVVGFYYLGEALKPWTSVVQIVSGVVTVTIIVGAAIRFRKQIFQYVRFALSYSKQRYDDFIVRYAVWRYT